MQDPITRQVLSCIERRPGHTGMFDSKAGIADFTRFYGELSIDEVRGMAIGIML